MESLPPEILSLINDNLKPKEKLRLRQASSSFLNLYDGKDIEEFYRKKRAIVDDRKKAKGGKLICTFNEKCTELLWEISYIKPEYKNICTIIYYTFVHRSRKKILPEAMNMFLREKDNLLCNFLQHIENDNRKCIEEWMIFLETIAQRYKNEVGIMST